MKINKLKKKSQYCRINPKKGQKMDWFRRLEISAADEWGRAGLGV